MNRYVVRYLPTIALTCLTTTGWAFDVPSVKVGPGRDTVKPMKPDWCDGVDMSDADGDVERTFSRVERTVASRWDQQRHLWIAKIACMAPSDKKVQEAVAAWRQSWVNLVGTSEAEDRSLFKFRVSSDYEKQETEWCEGFKPEEEGSIRDKALYGALRMGTGCSPQYGPTVYPNATDLSAGDADETLGWWIDEYTEPPSELARAVFVTSCLRNLPHDAQWPDTSEPYNMARFAVCGADARRMDRAKLDKEIADKKFNHYAKINAIETFATAKAVYDYMATEYNKKAAKDAAYKTVLFDAPEKGWSDWDKTYAANKAVFDAARAYATKFYGPSKTALLGCGDSFRKGLATYLKSKAPKTAEQAFNLAIDPIGYSIWSAMALCDALEARYTAAQFEIDLFSSGQDSGPVGIQRGPRLAAYTAASKALADVLADRDKFPIKGNMFHPKVEQPTENLLHGAFDAAVNKGFISANPAKDVIQSVKKEKNGFLVTFPTRKRTVPNRVCVRNGRINGWGINGEPIYDSDCHIEGTITLNNTVKPVVVPNEFGAGLKAGQFGEFLINEGTEPRQGIPRMVFANEKADKLLIWYGFQLQ